MAGGGTSKHTLSDLEACTNAHFLTDLSHWCLSLSPSLKDLAMRLVYMRQISPSSSQQSSPAQCAQERSS
ncbi:hypothetical protein WJX74_009127 [Apatococcus lobatus]|uniref:Uncharacterized protein n=1 Tax=Apatococcus lobatus TaxID=904363 RepID=A0AAW1QKD4_9CHLO